MSALKHRCFKLQWSQLAVWLDKKLHITSRLRETVTTLLMFRSVGVWRFPCSAATACESQIGEEGRWWVSYLHWGYNRLLCRMNRACSISLEELGVLFLDVCGPLKIILKCCLLQCNFKLNFPIHRKLGLGNTTLNLVMFKKRL